jgi:hypothetical protein
MGKLAYSAASFSLKSKQMIHGLLQPAASFHPAACCGRRPCQRVGYGKRQSRLPQSKVSKNHSLAFPQILMHGSAALAQKVRFVLALRFPFSG